MKVLTILIEEDVNLPDLKQYHGFIPELKGFHASGSTHEETVINMAMALIAWIHSLQKHNEKIFKEEC